MEGFRLFRKTPGKITEAGNFDEDRAKMGSGSEAEVLKILTKWKIARTPKGAARSAAPLGRRRRRCLVVFHLVRISYVSASLPEPILARFSSKLAGSINFPRGLPKRSENLHLTRTKSIPKHASDVSEFEKTKNKQTNKQDIAT